MFQLAKALMNGLLMLVLLGSSGMARSADGQTIEAPEPPPPLQSGEPLEPEVTIRRTPRATIYEYRRNGSLFMIRVLPSSGAPYYFVDTDGDGALDYQPGEPVQDSTNQWILLEW